MRFVLTYFGSGIDGRGALVTCPVEAESAGVALAQFLAAVTDALHRNLASFQIWGVEHYAHNFAKRITPERRAYIEKVAELKRVRPPVVAERQSDLFVLRGPRFLTIDDWFQQTAALPA